MQVNFAVVSITRSASVSILKVLVIASVLGLWFYAWYRNDERRLKRDFAHLPPFDGPLENCLIRFPAGETKTDCVLGVNSEGLYLSSSAQAIQRNKWLTWRHPYYVLRTPLLIPWNRLQYSQAKFPLRDYVRFSVPSNNTTFFVPRPTAEVLLTRADRPLPLS